MEHAVGQRAPSRDTVRGVYWVRHRPCPTDVALSRILGGGQGDESAEPLLTALEGEVAQGDVVGMGSSCVAQVPLGHTSLLDPTSDKRERERERGRAGGGERER